MARFTIMAAVLAALLCLSGISASRGAERNLLVGSRCIVNTDATLFLANQFVCESAYEDACAEHAAHFCRNPNEPVPDTVTVTTRKKAVAIARAVAKACAGYSVEGWVSPACEIGSYSAFEAEGRAQAMAQATAESIAKAAAKVYGLNAFDRVYGEIEDESRALATTCYTQYAEICGPYHKCVKDTCDGSKCGLHCNYWDDAVKKAAAKAVAVSIARVQVLVTLYYSSNDCDDACKQRLCGYTCPDGCTTPVEQPPQ